MHLSLRNPMILLGLCGAATGLLNGVLMVLDADVVSRLFGLFFGIAVVAALRFLTRISLWHGLIILISFAASWELAVQFAVGTYEIIEPDYLTGAAAGAIGATIVALGFAVVYAGARRPTAFLRTVLIGTLAGTLLTVDVVFVLLVTWQTAVAASLGHAIIPQSDE